MKKVENHCRAHYQIVTFLFTSYYYFILKHNVIFPLSMFVSSFILAFFLLFPHLRLVVSASYFHSCLAHCSVFLKYSRWFMEPAYIPVLLLKCIVICQLGLRLISFSLYSLSISLQHSLLSLSLFFLFASLPLCLFSVILFSPSLYLFKTLSHSFSQNFLFLCLQYHTRERVRKVSRGGRNTV